MSIHLQLRSGWAKDLEIADTYERMFSLSGKINQSNPSKGDRHFFVRPVVNGVREEEKKAKGKRRPSIES